MLAPSLKLFDINMGLRVVTEISWEGAERERWRECSRMVLVISAGAIRFFCCYLLTPLNLSSGATKQTKITQVTPMANYG